MTGYNYQIVSAWGGPAASPAQIGAKFLRMLDALSVINPPCGIWTVPMGREDFEPQPLDNVRADFTRFVEGNFAFVTGFEPDPDDGYSLVAAINFRDPESSPAMSFFLTEGSPTNNTNAFEIGSAYDPPDPEAITYPLYKAVLLTMLSIWPAPWANASVSQWGEKPVGPGGTPFPQSPYRMPWMAYLCAERAARLYPPPGVPTERTPDGGLLMIAADTRFDPTNAEHMARSRILAEILIAHGGDPIR